MTAHDSLVPALNRIVVGDVGSGKTIVGFLSGLGFLHGVEQGVVVLLAPTEVLAWQHYVGLLELVGNIDDEIECVYSAGKTQAIGDEKMTPKAWEKQVGNLKGKQFWVGTHALLHREGFSADFVMVDEQHRFGVQQRKQLTAEHAHYLSFSATPIPRTLALTVYKHLQPLYLERLPGRVDIATSIETKDHWNNVVSAIQSNYNKGKKTYVVCPQVVDNDTDVWSVSYIAEELSKLIPEVPTIAIHGKQKDKKQLLSDFAEGGPAVLVATSVIEVGVDVSEATLMVIVNAERFGLASLHQIRGRVGRNSYTDNTCILVTEKHGIFNQRLKALVDTQNGIELAQIDLELRGSGQLLGTGQSGVDEIQDLIGLEPEFYESICAVAERVSKERPDSLNRLNAYVDKKVSEVWKE